MTYRHPLRDANIAVYETTNENSPKFLAFIEPISAYPIRFSGSTRKIAEDAAINFCTDAADKHESAYVSKMEARAKAKAKKERRSEGIRK